MNVYPPETEPLHAAGPPDNPDEPIERITDIAEDVDLRRIVTVAKDADSAADTKIVIHSDSATLFVASSTSDSVMALQGTPFFSSSNFRYS